MKRVFIETKSRDTTLCNCQVHTFYEAVGYMIQAQADTVVQERLIEKCMSLPNQVYSVLFQFFVLLLCNVLKTNISAL